MTTYKWLYDILILTILLYSSSLCNIWIQILLSVQGLLWFKKKSVAKLIAIYQILIQLKCSFLNKWKTLKVNFQLQTYKIKIGNYVFGLTILIKVPYRNISAKFGCKSQNSHLGFQTTPKSMNTSSVSQEKHFWPAWSSFWKFF